MHIIKCTSWRYVIKPTIHSTFEQSNIVVFLGKRINLSKLNKNTLTKNLSISFEQFKLKVSCENFMYLLGTSYVAEHNEQLFLEAQQANENRQISKLIIVIILSILSSFSFSS